jgi:ribosomal protein L32E
VGNALPPNVDLRALLARAYSKTAVADPSGFRLVALDDIRELNMLDSSSQEALLSRTITSTISIISR